MFTYSWGLKASPSVLIDDERRFVFLHIPRTAGTAVASALGYKHDSSHHSLNGIGAYRDYFRFCFVRDPLARFLSSYRYTIDMAGRGVINDKHPLRGLLAEHGLDMSAQAFVNIVREMPRELLFSNLHFRPQMSWIRRGRPSYIGRAETLRLDLQRIAAIVGLDLPSEVQQVNMSKASGDTRLSEEARAWIRQVYADDYRALGYDRPWVTT